MDINKLTFKSQEALQAAQRAADERNQQQIAPEHLLHALLSEAEGAVYPTLQKLGASPRTLRDGVLAMLDRMPKTYVQRPAGQPGQVYLSPELATVLDRAEKEADTLKDAYISTEHLLLALAGSEGAVGELLREAGGTKDAILQALVDVRGAHSVQDQDPESKFQA